MRIEYLPYAEPSDIRYIITFHNDDEVHCPECGVWLYPWQKKGFVCAHCGAVRCFTCNFNTTTCTYCDETD